MSESEIRRLSRERNECIGRRDFGEMVDAFYAKDAQMLPSGLAAVRGSSDIRDFWCATPETGLLSLTLEARTIEASGDLAYEIGTFYRTIRPRHGPPFQEIGKYMVVYRLESGGAWKAVAEMFNTDAHR